VYLCGQRHAEQAAGGGEGCAQRVAMLFGVSLSGDCVHAALGVTEATMIAPVSISMPPSEACFHSVVHRVLACTEHPVVLSGPVFRMLRDEFTRGSASVAALERALGDVYTLHFMNSGLASVFADRRTVPSYLLDGEAEDAGGRADAVRSLLTGELSQELANAKACDSVKDLLPERVAAASAVLSDLMVGSAALGPDALERACQERLDVPELQSAAVQWHDQLCQWRWRCRAVREATWQLADALKVSLDEKASAAGLSVAAGKRRLRTALYEQFLPDAQEGGPALAELWSDPRKTILLSVHEGLGRLAWPHLVQVLGRWAASIDASVGRRRSAPMCSGLRKIAAEIGELQAFAQSKMPGSGGGGPASEAVAEIAASTPQQPRTGAGAPGIVDTSVVGRSTFDAALCVADKGERGTAKRRARGGQAMREKRQRGFSEAAARATVRRDCHLDDARERARTLFHNMLKLVEPLQTLPMHEVVLFQDAVQLRQHSGGMSVSAQPRASYFHALRHPEKYTKLTGGRNVPDIALAYSMLADSGQNVNLSAWCNGYEAMRRSTVTGASGDRGRDEDRRALGAPPAVIEDAAPAALAEFAHVVPELEFLGFLKHTNRRVDHVVRLVYE
jgi:hypothetical protein